MDPVSKTLISVPLSEADAHFDPSALVTRQKRGLVWAGMMEILAVGLVLLAIGNLVGWLDENGFEEEEVATAVVGTTLLRSTI